MLWAIPTRFVPVSGAIELAGAVERLIPVVRGLPGVGLALLTIGAVAPHVVHAEIDRTFAAGASGLVAVPRHVGFFRTREGPSP
jgi:hypothetical protein